MGFRNGAYATIWEVTPVSDRVTRCRLSISRKRKDTGEYEQDFGGFVSFLGTAAASKAARLHERDRIQLGQVEVTNTYDKVQKKEYTNFNCYEFDIPDNFDFSPRPQQATTTPPDMEFLNVEEGAVDEEFLPF